MSSTSDTERRAPSARDIIVVGAGFAGLYTLHLLRSRGWNVCLFEAGGDLGGTWYWNRYPGARCDIQSLAYAYTFDEALQREWSWSERYATQPEILRYLNFVAERLDLRRDIRFGRRIVRASFDSAANRWAVLTDHDEKASATYLIMATGALSAGRLPDIPGIDTFKRACYHTGTWPHEGVSFAGKRVAVIGTGSSGVQIIPMIAREAAHLTVFQRTPAFVAPARNAPMPHAERAAFRNRFTVFRDGLRRGQMDGTGDVILSEHLPPTRRFAPEMPPEERQRIMQARWEVGGASILNAFSDFMVDEAANDALAEFFRAKVREIVKNPVTATRLTPVGYPFGSKRICIGSDYYEAFNRPNVALADATVFPIVAMTPEGIRTAEREYEFDIVVFATGFDAFTGALSRIEIENQGRTLKQAWSAGPHAYLGLAVAGFPNLFTLTGPGSPSALGNVVSHIEQHVEWVADLLSHLRERSLDRVDVDEDAQREWMAHVAEIASDTLFMKGRSWYLGDNVPGKSRVFMAYIRGIGAYRDICDRVVKENYRGLRPSSTGDLR